MKKMNRLFIILSLGLVIASCDKDFEEINTDPNAVTDVEPGYLFTNALRGTNIGGLESDLILAQQFYNPYAQATTLGFNQNSYHEGQNVARWNGDYGGPVKHLVHLINMVKDDPSRSNLYNEARIWLAFTFMQLVDTYGDVPYTEAGKAYLEGVFYPKYDNDETIYASLRTELKEASAALDPAKSNEAKYDLFYQGDVAKWKRLGYSILLRLGMRYSKKDQALAKTIVQEAYNGGVMVNNNDNVLLTYNTVNTNPFSASRSTNSNYFYYAEPFINQLKSTNDPRLKFLAGKYQNAGGSHLDIPDTTTANQHGFPIGQNDGSIATYSGRVTPLTRPGGGYNYSQINYFVVGNPVAPVYIITNAQTKLLLAEAAFRTWLPSGAKTAQEYYEEGVKAALDEWSKYPNGISGSGFVSISPTEQNNFLAQSNVAYNATDALKLINTQYWIASFGHRSEAWFNFRRSGFPALAPNNAVSGGNLLGGDGFVHRFIYPIAEQVPNKVNYNNAKTAMGGDTWLQRVFWDVQ
jgi:hypothetical protein